ncbi:MAG TPA: acyltransferase, partial [Candidatus Hydrogenedentes bacterium]|nr:acyltransferase [Candidatus Hydrogenedentota bacterium]
MRLLERLLRYVYLVYVGVGNHVVNRIPFNAVRIFIYRHLYFMKIGKGTGIEMGVTFRRPRSIRIGCNSFIHHGCFLDGLATLTIGDNVDIGDYVILYCGGRDVRSADYYGGNTYPIVIDDYACIFLRSTMIRGVHIGKGAVVGACSLVKEDVPPYTIVA